MTPVLPRALTGPLPWPRRCWPPAAEACWHWPWGPPSACTHSVRCPVSSPGASWTPPASHPAWLSHPKRAQGGRAPAPHPASFSFHEPRAQVGAALPLSGGPNPEAQGGAALLVRETRDVGHGACVGLPCAVLSAPLLLCLWASGGLQAVARIHRRGARKYGSGWQWGTRGMLFAASASTPMGPGWPPRETTSSSASGPSLRTMLARSPAIPWPVSTDGERGTGQLNRQRGMGQAAGSGSSGSPRLHRVYAGLE